MTQEEQLNFYMQVTAALLREKGGRATIDAADFERPAASILRRFTQEKTIELQLQEYAGRG